MNTFASLVWFDRGVNMLALPGCAFAPPRGGGPSTAARVVGLVPVVYSLGRAHGLFELEIGSDCGNIYIRSV